MRFLVDANVFIAIEPFDGRREDGHAIAARLYELVHSQGHQLFVHPAVVDDLARTNDGGRKSHNEAALKKYPILAEAPIVKALEKLAGASLAGSNDHRDLRLMAAVERSSVEYLVTEDVGLKKRAARAKLGDVVVGLAEAVSMLEARVQTVPDPFPYVDQLPSYSIDETQGIFSSIREDYPEFDKWMATKVRPDADGRLCWVVLDPAGSYRAIALLKRREQPPPLHLQGNTAKLTTYKVDARSSGQKLGELLLKAVFAWCVADDVDHLFVEVHSHLDGLIGFLGDFGFYQAGSTKRGEVVLAKDFKPDAKAVSSLSDLEYHTLFGPPSLRPTQQAFVVPMIPQWFDQLFPESVGAEFTIQPTLMGLEAEPRPVGSAIRKAYLSNSKTNLLAAGDLVLFYRSRPESGGAGYLYAAGVVESTLRSGSPQEVFAYVGSRTVYTLRDIESMAARGVLAVMFRQDRLIQPVIPLEELVAQQVLNGSPQSITKVATTKGTQWLIARILE